MAPNVRQRQPGYLPVVYLCFVCVHAASVCVCREGGGGGQCLLPVNSAFSGHYSHSV